MGDSHRPWLSGLELLVDAQQNKHFLPTGSEGIDMLLGGGLRKGQLIELVGASSSGKTQICMYAASHVSDKQHGAVMYLDTCNSFSAARISQIIECINPSAIEARVGRLKRVMGNIIHRSVYDIHSLLQMLHELELTICRKGTGPSICLLIVDSIASLIAPILGGKTPEGRSYMVSVGVLLKKLANEHNICVLVTNYMVGGERGTTKPALGESWKTIPHVRLLLDRNQGCNISEISVLKHTCIASGHTAKFVIHQ